MDAPILISPHWDIEFHAHTYAFNLVVEVMLVQNLTKKCNDRLPMHSGCSTTLNEIIQGLKGRHSHGVCFP